MTSLSDVLAHLAASQDRTTRTGAAVESESVVKSPASSLPRAALATSSDAAPCTARPKLQSNRFKAALASSVCSETHVAAERPTEKVADQQAKIEVGVAERAMSAQPDACAAEHVTDSRHASGNGAASSSACMVGPADHPVNNKDQPSCAARTELQSIRFKAASAFSKCSESLVAAARLARNDAGEQANVGVGVAMREKSALLNVCAAEHVRAVRHASDSGAASSSTCMVWPSSHPVTNEVQPSGVETRNDFGSGAASGTASFGAARTNVAEALLNATINGAIGDRADVTKPSIAALSFQDAWYSPDASVHATAQPRSECKKSLLRKNSLAVVDQMARGDEKRFCAGESGTCAGLLCNRQTTSVAGAESPLDVDAMCDLLPRQPTVIDPPSGEDAPKLEETHRERSRSLRRAATLRPPRKRSAKKRSIPQRPKSNISKNSTELCPAMASEENPVGGDEFLARLMARRAERDAMPDNAEVQDLATQKQMKRTRGNPSPERSNKSSVATLQEQLDELSRVRAAANDAGWHAGTFSTDARELELAPELPPHLDRAKVNHARGRGGRRNATETHTASRYFDAELTTILDATEIRTSPDCAAHASDIWENHQRALISEASRVHQRFVLKRGRMAASTSSATPSSDEMAALEVLHRFRQRSKDEAGRRVLMRRCGACPNRGQLDKERKAVSRVAIEGELPAAWTIANEFEACTFVPIGELSSRIEEARQGFIGTWQQLDVDWLFEQNEAKAKDFRACAEVAHGFNAELAGSFVGRLARAGLTRDYPFLLQGGLDHFVCDACSQWVGRRNYSRHSASCNNGVNQMRVFRQACGEDLGARIRYKHCPSNGTVELSACAPLAAVIRRACWACYWEPDEIHCAWRLARRGSRPNSFPVTGSEGVAAFLTRLEGDDGELHPPECNGLEECSDDGSRSPSRERAAQARPPVSALRGDAASERKGHAISLTVDLVAPAPRFSLQSSFGTPPAEQPRSFLRPLSSAQLHSLGWMLKRENDVDGYTSTQVLRQAFSETDVCMELRLGREFKRVRGGILADQLGYGKTACMIGLIAETKGESNLASLSLRDWPETAAQRVLTNATLVVTPPNLFDQWLREFRKFVSPAVGLRILAVPNQNKLRSVTVSDFVNADVVLVSFRFFFSNAYQRYFDEIAKPGLKVWDESSVANREKLLQESRGRRGRAAGRGKGRGRTSIRRNVEGEADSCLTGVKKECETAEDTFAASFAAALDSECGAARGIEPEKHGVVEDMQDDAVQGKCPQLRLSNYYMELKARKDYAPQRYLDMERTTRRLLQQASAEELARSQAVFEMFCFKRVVFDEFHEVARAFSEQGAGGQRASALPFYALHALQGRCHWGLTATPLLGSAASVSQMASLLRVFLPSDDDKEAQHFLDKWVTSNTWDSSKVGLQEHWVEVDLTGAERALYLNQRNLLAEGSSGADARVAERRLLQLCTHFDAESTTVEAVAEELLELSLKVQKDKQIKLEQRLKDSNARREELWERSAARDQLLLVLSGSDREINLVCAHRPTTEVRGLAEAAAQATEGRLTSELALIEKDLRRLAQRVMDGGAADGCVPHKSEGACDACANLMLCDDKQKQLNRTQGHVLSEWHALEQQHRFCQSILACINQQRNPDQSKLECKACLDDLEVHGTVVLPCGHLFHSACAEALVVAQGHCPACQNPTSLHMLTYMEQQLSTSCMHDPIRVKYGSKLAKVTETILKIQREEGETTKCVVFIQWETIVGHLERALKTVGVNPLLLRGSLIHRQKTIAKFVDGNTNDSSVLLLSLEQSPVGMNLVCAHHVLLVHPMHAEQPEEAVSYEIQAIGRVRRQGQKNTVHVHRFVARDTVEELLARRHHAAFLQQERAQSAAKAASASAAGEISTSL